MADQIRVLRLIEFLGDREFVEHQVAASIHGTKLAHNGRVQITVTTINSEFPEVVDPPVKLGGARVG